MSSTRKPENPSLPGTINKVRLDAQKHHKKCNPPVLPPLLAKTAAKHRLSRKSMLISQNELFCHPMSQARGCPYISLFLTSTSTLRASLIKPLKCPKPCNNCCLSFRIRFWMLITDRKHAKTIKKIMGRDRFCTWN
jgi:hypothetical protein